MNKKHTIGYGATAVIALLVGTGIGSSSGEATEPTSASATPATTITAPGATATVPGPTVTVTATSVKTVTSEPKVAVAMEGDGTYEVGVDVKPGTYVSSKPDSGNCYWARLKGSGGAFGDIIANNNSSGRSVVTIKKSDKFFESSGCNGWTKR